MYKNKKQTQYNYGLGMYGMSARFSQVEVWYLYEYDFTKLLQRLIQQQFS